MESWLGRCMAAAWVALLAAVAVPSAWTAACAVAACTGHAAAWLTCATGRQVAAIQHRAAAAQQFADTAPSRLFVGRILHEMLDGGCLGGGEAVGRGRPEA
eukprot:366073-Chlamydomonas_euryale.AAC.5